jgi:hypothetical protein
LAGAAGFLARRAERFACLASYRRSNRAAVLLLRGLEGATMNSVAISYRFAARSLWCVTALGSILLAACSAPGPGNEEGTTTGKESSDDATSVQQPLLDLGTKETVVTGIASAENLVFAGDGRLFVTGDSGIYEIVRGPSKGYVANLLKAGGAYKFGGMAEIDGVLYVNAYTVELKSTLFAARLTAAPAFAPIHQLQGALFANGAAADEAGRLYVTDTLGGRIVRLTIDERDPLRIIKEETWLSAPLANGIKFFGASAYLTDGLTVKRIPVLEDGAAGAPTTVVVELTFFDDFTVGPGGILVTNYLFGAVELFTLGGRPILNTAIGAFNAPSSATPAAGRLGFATNDVLVTEKGGNLVSVYHPSF